MRDNFQHSHSSGIGQLDVQLWIISLVSTHSKSAGDCVAELACRILRGCLQRSLKWRQVLCRKQESLMKRLLPSCEQLVEMVAQMEGLFLSQQAQSCLSFVNDYSIHPVYHFAKEGCGLQKHDPSLPPTLVQCHYHGYFSCSSMSPLIKAACQSITHHANLKNNDSVKHTHCL